ncbi:protein adenylyltransferase SelO [Reyranella sp.]|uniref:protein adenylyltransferase SelO n=1 Tax=Reyranella sp. TaxID=1929291 RepID=UPI003BAC76F1
MANETGLAVSSRLAPADGKSAFPFDNRYARLPERFYARLEPTPVAAPRLLRLNEALACELGLDPAHLATPEGIAVLAGNRVAPGSEPIALAYAGHQFGNFVPQLGDGRAILLGEVIDRAGRRRDIQLKGSGPTPFSRRGDGRAAVGPVLREYIVSEAMAALGIPTTRSLAAVATGEPVFRETALPGAVLTRVASSHVRVGTFQFFAARGDGEALRLLADHVIDRHYPEARERPDPYRALFEAVIARQAALVARWMLVGFIHGVMNTDNCSVAGETIDYGPCAFMDTYDPRTVFSSIDQGGRYAYANQPRICHWNLARLGETLLPLLSDDDDKALAMANDSLASFQSLYGGALIAGMRRKLGLFTEEDEDAGLAQGFLDALAKGQADFTLAFRALDPDSDEAARPLFGDAASYDAWVVRWRERLAREPEQAAGRRAAMHAANPAYIPRNHRVEAALAAAIERDDYAPFEELVEVLSRPYEAREAFAAYADPPRPEERVSQTFCGT